jgi:choline dehydrogenase-like flavoprotein
LAQDNQDIVVIGSGPSGVAASRAFLDLGLSVTMYDTGETMPAAAEAIRETMASSIPSEWDTQAVMRLNAQGLKERDQVPLKTAFGSDYPYHFDPAISESGASILGSQARGGLSNVWGASLLPLSESDVANWPVSIAELEPHYRAVLKWVPHAQLSDDLAHEYPLYSDHERQLGLSRQAMAMLADLKPSARTLNAAGVRFGRARLAMSNCFYCGQCLIGCPYQFIYSTNETLAALEEHPGFRYEPGVTVKSLTETGSHVEIMAERNDALLKISAAHVFLGAGVINTAKLLAPLLGLRQIVIKDSAYNLIPFLRYERMPKVEFESLFTLPQLFMEIDVPELSSRNAHLQWYSYNDFYQQEMRKMLGWVYKIVPNMFPQQVIERMWTIQGFLHSDDSPDIHMNFSSDFSSASLSAESNPRTKKIFKAVYRKLSRYSSMLGGKPLPFFGRVGTPGGSFHAGGSFPMASNPQGRQSDLLGRPHGLQRIHIIDSSVLPNIASSTITLSVMANAHRIATDFVHSK